MEPICPLVSVVVPVYAGEQTLPDLIKRCKAIRDGNGGMPRELLHELIFVCDEPIDGSEPLLNAADNQFDWIRVISLARNSGQHLATSVGILYSSGDWVLTLDEDLQHPPEMIAQVLVEALDHGLDLLYVKSTIRVHGSSLYRDITSRASKICMKVVTHDDYSGVSSFRMIRGEVARSIAISIDGNSYLDAVLFAVTSAKRRDTFYSEFSDTRGAHGSGYSFKKLLRHYGRLIMSAEFSGLRMMITLGSLFGIPLLMLMLVLLVVGWFGGTQQIAPGWLSLFFLTTSLSVLFLMYAVYSLKLLSVLFSRSSGSPQFLVISRELDSPHREYLSKFS